MKLVVIGGLSGGMTTASQFRRLDKDSEIIVFDRNEYVSFANCGLPYYLSREVNHRDQLIAKTPEQLKEKGIDVYTKHEVIEVKDTENKVVVKNLTTDEVFEESYDNLVISPGGIANQLDAVKDAKQTFTFQYLHQLDHLDHYISEHNVKKAVVIGTGFIGLEVTENLSKRGLDVTVLQYNDQIYSSLEQDLTQYIKEEMDHHNIHLKLNTSIETLNGTKATLNNGEILDAPLIIMAVGIQPRTKFLESSNVKMVDGYIPIDEYGVTNIDNIYALGDAILTHYQHVPEKMVNVALAWPSHRLAFVIANHLAKNDVHKHDGLLSVSIMRFFDCTVGQMGLSLQDLKDEDYITVEHTQDYKSAYMPGAKPLTLRIYVDKTSRKILRAVGIGEKGVDKRIDVLSTLTRLGGTVDDLIDIEVAYAPPYGNPTDLENMLGYKAIGKLQ